ncbi:hypothetical protein BKA83DRAFT_4120408 [Pisolithus microcarpus]|nr:hypothetical protein BKA83DRAFT_4120408 [Pisolithus microcarpus]
MARTKQTARKVTGDKAPRVHLKTLHKRKGKATLSSQKPVLKKALSNSFCVMCRDGGVLWICDEIGCNRVICHRCLIVPEQCMGLLKEDGITFKCITCHWKEAQNSKPQPHFGDLATIIKLPPDPSVPTACP